MPERKLPNRPAAAGTRRETEDADLGLVIFASIERIRVQLARERERLQASLPKIG